MADPDDERIAAGLERHMLESWEAKLSFVAAALVGAEQIAGTMDAELGREISRVCLRALGIRRNVRVRLREMDRPATAGSSVAGQAGKRPGLAERSGELAHAGAPCSSIRGGS